MFYLCLLFLVTYNFEHKYADSETMILSFSKTHKYAETLCKYLVVPPCYLYAVSRNLNVINKKKLLYL